MPEGLLGIMEELSWDRVRKPHAFDLWSDFKELRGKGSRNAAQEIQSDFLDCICSFPEAAHFLQEKEEEACHDTEAAHLWNCLREKAVALAESSTAHLGWLSAHPAKPIT